MEVQWSNDWRQNKITRTTFDAVIEYQKIQQSNIMKQVISDEAIDDAGKLEKRYLQSLGRKPWLKAWEGET
ncbi:hypothetical protein ACLOJK_040062 [Asimina triloba]